MAAAAARFPFPADFIRPYLSRLRYEFGPAERAGLEAFLEPSRAQPASSTSSRGWRRRIGDVSDPRAPDARRRDPRADSSPASASRRGRPGAARLARPRERRRGGRRGGATRDNDPGVVTFVIDRNVNYTNFCITDCDFCAFYRRPMDPEGYVLPKR